MPEGEPCAQRLADVDHQDCYCTAVTDKTDYYRRIQDWLQLGSLQDVNQKSGEECSRTQRDDAEIQKNPQAEREAVVHLGLVQAVVKAQSRGIPSHRQQQ